MSQVTYSVPYAVTTNVTNTTGGGQGMYTCSNICNINLDLEIGGDGCEKKTGVKFDFLFF